jgi:hypothetical protein
LSQSSADRNDQIEVKLLTVPGGDDSFGYLHIPGNSEQLKHGPTCKNLSFRTNLKVLFKKFPLWLDGNILTKHTLLFLKSRLKTR